MTNDQLQGIQASKALILARGGKPDMLAMSPTTATELQVAQDEIVAGLRVHLSPWMKKHEVYFVNSAEWDRKENKA